MNRLSLKRRASLALVSVTEPQAVGESFQLNSHVLDRTFYGWLAGNMAVGVEQSYRPLTTEDFIQVELATVRESQTHRRWPRQIVEKFLAADVIAR